MDQFITKFFKNPKTTSNETSSIKNDEELFKTIIWLIKNAPNPDAKKMAQELLLNAIDNFKNKHYNIQSLILSRPTLKWV